MDIDKVSSSSTNKMQLNGIYTNDFNSSFELLLSGLAK